MRIIKSLLSSIVFLFIFNNCTSQKTQIGSSIKVFFVPNKYSTYEYGKATFRNEYKDYGVYFEVESKDFEKNIVKLLPSLQKTKGGRSGKRIKLVIYQKEKVDSIFLPFSPNAKVELNGKTYQGNPKLYKLIMKEIVRNYKKGNYVCKGIKCSKNPEEKNIKFLEMMSYNLSN